MTTNGNTTVVGAITNANIENSGILTAGAVTGNITNDGTSVTTSGLVTGDVTNNTGTYTNNGGISGNVENSGIFESNALISGGTITNNTGASLTSNASNLGSAVTNNGDLYLTGTGTNGNAITGSGTTNISAGADVTNNSTIAQAVINNATLTNASTISGNVTNNSSIDNTSGVISGNVVNVSGAGITTSADNVTGTITNDGSLTLAGGTTQNTISGNGTTDITGDLTVNKALQQSVLKLSGGKTSLTSPSTVAVTTLDASGGALNLQNNNIGAINLTNLKLNSDMNLSIDADLNTKTADTISATSVDANGHKVIIDSIKVLADPADAVPVDVVVADSNLKEHVRLTTSTMNVDGATPGISYLVTYTASGGTLNFGYSNLVSAVQSTADSKNYTMAGDENITATIGTLNGDELTVNGQGNTINSSSTANDGISVGDNKTLNINNATISNFGTALENSSAGEINLTNVVFSGNNTDVDNDGTLNLNNVQVTGGISGAGTTNITANSSSIFDANVTQTDVAVGSGASLDNNAIITADVTNNGNLDNSDGSIFGDVTNNDILNNAGGIINGVVTNNVNGTVDNTGGSIVGNVISSSTGSIDNTSGSITGKVTNNGTGSIDNTSGNITGDVLNASSGNIGNAGGTIAGNVDNTGSGNINNAGTIAGNVNNTGSGILDNTNGTIGGNVTNSGTLVSVADDIAGTTANNGTFTLNGGTVQNDISGTGTTNVTADLSNPHTIGQDTISVNSGVTVTNNGTINAATALTLNGDLDNNVGSSLTAGTLTNNGTLKNLGSVTVGGGVNSGNIKGIGSLTNTGNLTNNASIVQNTVANSGNLVNNGTIVAASVTNSAGSTITSDTQNLISSSPIANNGTLNLTGSTTYSDISGAAAGKVNINSDSSLFILNNKIQGNELTFNGDILKFGTNGNLANVSQFNFNANAVDLVNNNIANTNFGNLNLLSDMNLSLDGNFAQQTLDTISVTGFNSNGNFINISDINILEPTTAQTFSISPIGEDVSGSVRSALASAIRYTGGDLVYSPIFKYSAAYDPASGMINFTNLNGGDNFNPAVLVAPVVAQSAGQVTMWQNFNTAFEHADTFMPYPKALRTAQQNANMYAISTDYNDNIDVISEMGYEHTNLAGWAKPYTTFESINLAHGPKLDIISYGTILGGDSDFRKLKNGWSNVGTLYMGYNGSQIDYDDVDVTTNGGTIGITETFYKNNFFTAITAAAGAGVAQAHTMYGKEDLTTIMAGIGSKSGYNFEFLDGRFIIQPTLQLNYSMVKTFDYTNAAGVRVNSDPAHTLQINPNIRFIGNFKGGWQPYASVGMIWNVMNVSHNIANGAELPRMYTKPYVEYGVGLQKQIGVKFSGYGQVMVRNGGRTGVALTAGFRWYLGRKKDKDTNLEKNVGNKTVIKKSKSTNKKKNSKKTTNISPKKNEYNLDLIKLNSAKSQVNNTPETKNIVPEVKPSVEADKTKNAVKKSAKSQVNTTPKESTKSSRNIRARYEKYFEN